ncbi:MAG: hypothetical protein R3F60_07280 [bacterium]
MDHALTPQDALPEATAEAGIVAFFAAWRVLGVTTTQDAAQVAAQGATLASGQWAILVPHTAMRVLDRVLPPTERARVHAGPTRLVIVQPAGSLRLKAPARRRLLAACDRARPLQPNGLPFPWVPPPTPTAPLGRPADEDDVTLDPGEPGDATDVEAVQRLFTDLCGQLALRPIPLVVRQGSVNKQGFVTGRVHLRRDGQPVRVVVTLCPNADEAEVAATLIHELAHVLSGERGHGPAFLRCLIQGAERVWGAAWFAPARTAASHELVDAWIACGIRAHLTGGRPPAPVHPDEAQVAVVVRRIQKLRALAADQQGRPEGRLAAATANDLIVTHGLGAYRVALPADLGDALCDVWILIGSRATWKARICFAIAEFCGVFALESSQHGGMHLFGRHADVVVAEYLHAVATAGIERRCEAHLDAWRREHPRRPPAPSTPSATASCSPPAAASPRRSARPATAIRASAPRPSASLARSTSAAARAGGAARRAPRPQHRRLRGRPVPRPAPRPRRSGRLPKRLT